MALTDLQKGLIYLLKAYEMTEDEAIGTMLILKTPRNYNAIIDWMETHTYATADEVIQEAINIRNEGK